MTPRLADSRWHSFYVALIYNLTEHAFRDLHPVWQAFLFAVVAIPQLKPPETPLPLDTDHVDHFEPLPQPVGVQGEQMVSGRPARQEVLGRRLSGNADLPGRY